MKTKVAGIFAIALAISLCAFTSTKKHKKYNTGPYWFLIDYGIPKGSYRVLSSEAFFIRQSPNPPNELEFCDGVTYQCLSGFDENQVNTITNELKDNFEISGHQANFDN